jgi:hypothetical protein
LLAYFVVTCFHTQVSFLLQKFITCWWVQLMFLSCVQRMRTSALEKRALSNLNILSESLLSDLNQHVSSFRALLLFDRNLHRNYITSSIQLLSGGVVPHEVAGRISLRNWTQSNRRAHPPSSSACNIILRVISHDENNVSFFVRTISMRVKFP